MKNNSTKMFLFYKKESNHEEFGIILLPSSSYKQQQRQVVMVHYASCRFMAESALNSRAYSPILNCLVGCSFFEDGEILSQICNSSILQLVYLPKRYPRQAQPIPSSENKMGRDHLHVTFQLLQKLIAAYCPPSYASVGL